PACGSSFAAISQGVDPTGTGPVGGAGTAGGAGGVSGAGSAVAGRASPVGCEAGTPPSPGGTAVFGGRCAVWDFGSTGSSSGSDLC
ncbi:hypothetical protein PJM28_28900, partial [Mycobacterium kansasii]